MPLIAVLYGVTASSTEYIAVSFNASLLVMMGIFWVTYWILRRFFFAPMMDLLEQRQATVDTAQSVYDEAMTKTSEMIEAERSRLNEARRNALASRQQERRAALSRRLEQLNEVKAQVHEILASAAGELEERVARERETLEQKAQEIADFMAERLLGRSV